MATTPAKPAAATAQASAKSGMRQLKPGEVLFNDGESADSLFIIQKGQLRLYKPKGKGFIEIAVLRTGEVIGEMAFFDEDGTGKKRSCAAAAMTPTEVIEISFAAFGKTMASLNPWFKTIINTLAARLRKANQRIKELESNSMTSSYGGKPGSYEFMKASEVLKVLATIFLVYKAHGEKHEKGISVHRKTMELYSSDVYNITEAKMDAILIILKELGWLEMLDDQDKNPFVLVIKNIDLLRQIFIFSNTEKHLPDEKKMKISQSCETIMERMLAHAPKNPMRDIPNLKKDEDGAAPKFTQYYFLNPVMEELKNKNIPAKPEHLEDARSIGVVGELLMQNGEALIECDLNKLTRMYPVVKFLNKVTRTNEEKGGF